jgi:hypothetical protein
MTAIKTFLLSVLLICLTTLPVAAGLPKVDPPRAWVTAKGQTFTATLLNFDGTTAVFKMPNGQPAKAPGSHFDEANQQYLRDWLEKQPIKFTTPDVVAVDISKIRAEMVSEDEAGEKYVYRTDHFEFTSQGKFGIGLLRDVSRTFEATYELLRALPWGIDPKPASGTHFKALLLKNREEYMKAGGVPNSGGVYMSRTETFYAPFESIGLKPYGKGYTKDADYKADVLVHELTHQMMHHWLRYLPNWIVEGTAEYTENLPLNAGRFRVVSAKTGLKDYTEFLKKRAVGGMPEPWPIDKLFTITNQEWGYTLMGDPTASRRMYFTAYLLVYYFMHMDGNGDSQRFIRFFRTVDKERKKDAPYRGEQAEAAFHAEMMKILLDGRTEEDLMKQIRTGYARLGIKL